MRKTLENQFAFFLRANWQELKSEWHIPNIIQNTIDTGETRLKVLNSGNESFDVTYPEDSPAVDASLKPMHYAGKYKYPPKLWE